MGEFKKKNIVMWYFSIVLTSIDEISDQKYKNHQKRKEKNYIQTLNDFSQFLKIDKKSQHETFLPFVTRGMGSYGPTA